MRPFLGVVVSPPVKRLVIASVAVVLLAGCSSDATRLAGVGNSSSADLMPTASIPTASERAAQAHPTIPVQSKPLGPVSSRPLPPPHANFVAPSTPSPKLAASVPAPQPMTTGSTMRASGNASGWSAEGGTPIVVAQGETLGTLSARYGVPTEAFLRTNGFTSVSEVHPGTRLVVPVYNSGGAGITPAPARTAARIEPSRTAENRSLTRPAAPRENQVAAARPVKPNSPGVSPAVPHGTADAKSQPRDLAATPKVATLKPAAIELPPTRQPVDARRQSAPAVDRDTTTASLPNQADTTADADRPEFRWPAHGRVIQAFKAGTNDGINIAVPEGTAVKAAESGVVAYAGSELEGYGNLVLIRHPNGFLSAYANNGEIEVKRGDQVRRGQVIAKSGQSGNVNAPQLHFELRKGSTPVDPTGYLANL